MRNEKKYINQRFAFKNSRISCLSLIFKLKNLSHIQLIILVEKSESEFLSIQSCTLKNQLQLAKYDESYSPVSEVWKTLSVGHCLKVISRIQE